MNKDLVARIIAKCDTLEETLRAAKENYDLGMARAAKELRLLREDAGVSLRTVAKNMGLSAPYVSDVELGRRGLNTGLIQKYVAALNGKHK